MTGRRWIAYSPGVIGARTWNVNVPVAPGTTVASVCGATRFADGQPTFMPSVLKAVVSPFTPSATWLPARPLVQVFVPVFRKRSVTCEVEAGCIAGTCVCDVQAECRPLSVGTLGVGPPPLIVAPVLKSHSFVSQLPATVMS